MRDIIPNESDIKLNQCPPTHDWAKIRGYCEEINYFSNQAIQLLDSNQKDIFDELGVIKC